MPDVLLFITMILAIILFTWHILELIFTDGSTIEERIRCLSINVLCGLTVWIILVFKQ